jgi:arsenate reductase
VKKIIFICTHNSARSQIAEGYLNYYKKDKFKAFSAGTEPSKVNPCAVRVMDEIGIDISTHSSKSVEDFLGTSLDYVVTICDSAKETCPFFSGGKEYIHKSFSDPSDSIGTDDEILANFRNVRDEIIAWIDLTFQ